MGWLFGESQQEREDREFDAGDLSHDGSDAQRDAAADYDSGVGQSDHATSVAGSMAAATDLQNDVISRIDE